MKILSIVGARPQFIKLAPIAKALSAHEHVIVHTGQHYDPAMSDVFFTDLEIPEPIHLNIGSGSHGAQTGAMLTAIEPVIAEHSPDWVLVYGDTNSTIAGALAAVKLHVPLAHLEAGLRSFNRRMPEEHNRVLTDHAADLCLAPTQQAMEHLAHEGLSARSVLVGDVMTDVCFQTRDLVADQSAPLDGDYVLATIHRAENTDDRHRLRTIVDALADITVPVLLLAHPRLRARAEEFGIPLHTGSLRLAEPLPYPQMVRAVMGARGVVTDSGGLQKEAYLLGTPCTTLRTETEWTETLDDAWNVLDPNLLNVSTSALRQRPNAGQPMHYGDGHAAARVVSALENWH